MGMGTRLLSQAPGAARFPRNSAPRALSFQSFAGHASEAKYRYRQRPAAALSPRSQTMANPFVHVELHTKDLAKAKTFYGQLFGWQLQDTPMPGGGGTYTMIGVDDLEAMTERAKEL